MSRANTDQIIAHVDLLRSIDRLLSQAEIVRKKRAMLDKLLADADTSLSGDTGMAEGHTDAR